MLLAGMQGFKTSGEKSTGNIEAVRDPDRLLSALFVDIYMSGLAMVGDNSTLQRLKATGTACPMICRCFA